MQCPYCGGDSAVLDSRGSPEGIRRRRACNDCKRRFTTYERLASPSIKVLKRSGKTEPFDSSKIIRVLERVGRDRPGFSHGDAIRLARALEAQLLDEGVKSISSGEIVGKILDLLREVDKLSHDRLAANYVDESGQLRIDGRADESRDGGQLGLFEPDGGGD